MIFALDNIHGLIVRTSQRSAVLSCVLHESLDKGKGRRDSLKRLALGIYAPNQFDQCGQNHGYREREVAQSPTSSARRELLAAGEIFPLEIRAIAIGKTIQAIAAIRLLNAEAAQTSLIVVPAGLVRQWRRQYGRGAVESVADARGCVYYELREHPL